MQKYIVFVIFFSLVTCCSLQAATIGFSTYDVYHADPTGTGGWSHTYTGTKTASGSYLNYTGGSGTLNDGIPTSEQNTQIFYAADAAITLHLSTTASISVIELYGFSPGNTIPGNITGFDVVINGVRRTYSSVAFGSLSAINVPVNERVTLDSTQNTLITSTIIIDHFTYDNVVYCIGEVVLTGTAGTPPPVPEPSTMALCGLTLGLMLFLRRKF